MTERTESAELVEVDDPHTPARVIGGMPYFDQYLVLAERISRTAMVPANLRGKPDEVLAVVLYGAELGIGPMQALQQINFISGKPSASAELLRALVLEAGHQFIVTSNRETATARCRRKDWDEWQETTFTQADAALAGLGTGDGWRKYPDQMLAARVTSKACRMWFADVISGMSYTPEEVTAFSGQSEANDEPPASEESLAKLNTAISLLDERDTETLKYQWKEAGIPSLKHGLRESQCLEVLDLVDALLNATFGDVVEGELVDATAQLNARELDFAPEAERFT